MLLSLACCDIFGLRPPERPLCLLVGSAFGQVLHPPGRHHFGRRQRAGMVEPGPPAIRQPDFQALLLLLALPLLVFYLALFVPRLASGFQILLVLHPLVFHLASLNSGNYLGGLFRLGIGLVISCCNLNKVPCDGSAGEIGLAAHPLSPHTRVYVEAEQLSVLDQLAPDEPLPANQPLDSSHIQDRAGWVEVEQRPAGLLAAPVA